MTRFLMALILSAILLTPGLADVINYAEPADLTDFYAPPDPLREATDLGVFGVGLNTVSGSIKANVFQNPDADDTGDWWTAELPDGYQFDSIGIWIGYRSSSVGKTANLGYFEVGGFFFDDGLWDLALPSEDGFYLLDRSGFPMVGDLVFAALSFIDQDITGVEFDYRWEIEVSQIPTPAAAWLFGSALGLLGWLKRRAS